MAIAPQALAPQRVTDKDTGERFYPYPPTGEPLDSVTTLISGTNSKPWLKGWYANSSTAWCVDNLEQLARVKVTRDREAAIALGKDAAENLRGIKRDAGTYVHDVQEKLILWAASPGRTGADIELPPFPAHLVGVLYDDEPLAKVVDFMVTGFMNFVADFGPVFEATEMTVYNQPLGMAGTLDAIVGLPGYGLSPGGTQVIPAPGQVLDLCIDTKTGRTPEGTWKEQLAAYRRMPECMPDKLGNLQRMPLTDAGAVLHLRPEYPDGYLLMLVSAGEDEAAWRRFLVMAQGYKERQAVKGKPGKSIRPLRADGTMPGPRLCDLASEGYGRALAPLREALGAAAELEQLASFTLAEVLAVKGVGPKLIVTIQAMLADHGLSLRGQDLAFALDAVRGTAEQAVA